MRRSSSVRKLLASSSMARRSPAALFVRATTRPRSSRMVSVPANPVPSATVDLDRGLALPPPRHHDGAAASTAHRDRTFFAAERPKLWPKCERVARGTDRKGSPKRSPSNVCASR
jgi:hypothetical protein